MSDIQFIDGLTFKAPHQNAPDYVKAKGSINRAALIAWLQSRGDEWINFDVKESKGGKLYAAVDDWKPESKRDTHDQSRRQSDLPAKPAAAGGDRGGGSGGSQDDFVNDDIPFVTRYGIY